MKSSVLVATHIRMVIKLAKFIVAVKKQHINS